MWRVRCEWDLGLGGSVFTTKTRAIEAVKQAWSDCDIEPETGETMKSAEEGGLLSYQKVDVV